MNEASARRADQRRALIELYDTALPQVFGYLVSRCGSPSVAEDLSSETFMAAVDAIRRDTVSELTTAWLVGVARHKLVDHWRRSEREHRLVRTVEPDDIDDHWDARLDAHLAHQTLAQLGHHHRSALTLRYLDGLSVPEVARYLDRTVGATEVLLVRAKRAFRARYEAREEES